MRALAGIWFAMLLFGAPAFAAPTCQTRHGDTIRCGTAGAMPVGWHAPTGQWHPRAFEGGSDLPMTLIVLALFFALIALMPEFDGRQAGDWDRQDDDDA